MGINIKNIPAIGPKQSLESFDAVEEIFAILYKSLNLNSYILCTSNHEIDNEKKNWLQIFNGRHRPSPFINIAPRWLLEHCSPSPVHPESGYGVRVNDAYKFFVDYPLFRRTEDILRESESSIFKLCYWLNNRMFGDVGPMLYPLFNFFDNGENRALTFLMTKTNFGLTSSFFSLKDNRPSVPYPSLSDDYNIRTLYACAIYIALYEWNYYIRALANNMSTTDISFRFLTIKGSPDLSSLHGVTYYPFNVALHLECCTKIDEILAGIYREPNPPDDGGMEREDDFHGVEAFDDNTAPDDDTAAPPSPPAADTDDDGWERL